MLALAQLGRVEQEEELMKHLTQCVIGAGYRTWDGHETWEG